MKICGVTTVDDALRAQDAGADAVGFNLHPNSPRHVTSDRAAEIAEALTVPSILVVVHRTEEELGELVQEIQPSWVQLHGDQTPGFGAWLGTPVFHAHRASPGVLARIEGARQLRFLLDAYVPGEAGGTGKRVDLDLARRAAELGDLILAGGLNPDNVAATIRTVRPWGVDVASGVESSPGVKDVRAMQAFVTAARDALG
ncbi:MAG: phosphoribosylanthranilate isomerase [Proteobacteria bacterium]|nr:phosphoribosylanthranilate isomerase [Pseudomonadota bacterium]MCP4919439.1 phosphoribosylanthranilate isomerase [Pseudomonadota bacterium]